MERGAGDGRREEPQGDEMRPEHRLPRQGVPRSELRRREGECDRRREPRGQSDRHEGREDAERHRAAHGTTAMVAFDFADNRTIEVPTEWRDAIAAFQAGPQRVFA